jgi:hypothetical protein
MGMDYRDPGKIAGFTIFMFWMFWITHKSGKIIFNPVLIVFNWRLYEISYSVASSERKFNGIALSRKPITNGDRCRYGMIQDVIIIK